MNFSKYLNPKNDIAFKKIFGTEKNKDILIHFLNDMISSNAESPIEEVTFLNTTQDPDVKAQKTSVVDVLCKDVRGEFYIVEMQVARQSGFEKRAQYYASKTYCSQMVPGGEYSHLKKVIFFAIIDFCLFPNNEEYICEHVIMDKKTHSHDLKDFSFTFLELPKFNKKPNELTSMMDKWAYFFKHAALWQPEDVYLLTKDEGRIFERVYHELDKFHWNPADVMGYDQMEKYTNAYWGTIDFKYQEGRKEGKEEGKEEGRKEGKEEGRKEGKEEGKEEMRLSFAHKLLRSGMDPIQVKQLTDLSDETIQTILREQTIFL